MYNFAHSNFTDSSIEIVYRSAPQNILVFKLSNNLQCITSSKYRHLSNFNFHLIIALHRTRECQIKRLWQWVMIKLSFGTKFHSHFKNLPLQNGQI